MENIYKLIQQQQQQEEQLRSFLKDIYDLNDAICTLQNPYKSRIEKTHAVFNYSHILAKYFNAFVAQFNKRF